MTEGDEIIESTADPLPAPDEETTPDGQAGEAEAEETAPEAASGEEPIDYAAIEREDLDALTRAFPDLAGMESLTQLGDPIRYGELRDLGLTPEEAYLATAKRRPSPRPETRAHLHSAVPRHAGGSGYNMTAREMSAARELFSGMSDAEIQKLYRKVSR